MFLLFLQPLKISFTGVFSKEIENPRRDFFMLGYENMEPLKDRTCVPCEDKNMQPMTREEALSYVPMVSEWNLSDDSKEISRAWLFPDFAQAMIFVNNVADIAEETGHHPDIYIWYNKVELKLSTHSIKGLSENDFIVAAKIDAI